MPVDTGNNSVELLLIEEPEDEALNEKKSQHKEESDDGKAVHHE